MDAFSASLERRPRDEIVQHQVDTPGKRVGSVTICKIYHFGIFVNEGPVWNQRKLRLSRSLAFDWNCEMNIIRKLREQCGLTQTELARLVRTSQPQINRLEGGERQLSKDWAEKLAPHLGVAPAELMFGRVTNLSTVASTVSDAVENPANAAIGARLSDGARDVPVYGQAVGGEDGEFVLNGEKLDDVFRPPSLSSVIDAYAVYVAGSSMEPRYFDGEVVYVNPVKKVRRGDFVVAQIRDNERETILAYVKRFVRWNERELVLFQFNPERELIFQSQNVVTVHLAVMGGSV